MNVKVFPLLEDECLFWDFLKRKGGHLNCDKRSKYHILYNNSCVVVMPKWMSSSCFFIYIYIYIFFFFSYAMRTILVPLFFYMLEIFLSQLTKVLVHLHVLRCVFAMWYIIITLKLLI